MPAFLPGGPEIPERLLQLHEEGKVVFFCGAGISFPAGLPSFRDLVLRVYENLGTDFATDEQVAFAQSRFDQTLNQLEKRYRDIDRIKVRKAVASSLQPNWRKKGAKETHAALLQLAEDNNGTTRLVTTNFDRIFEVTKKQVAPDLNHFSAPFLPVPKPSKWDGIVYLHGLLPKRNPSDLDLNRLVVTSGDFGIAYLTERWASRFVSDLLFSYTVCFVGYSIEDPILRYMMDALAADELLGEKRIEAFAFASTSEDQIDRNTSEWISKGVTPILYKVPSGTDDHSALHSTLGIWSKIYKTGSGGKGSIISLYARNPPTSNSRSDFEVGQVLWALTDSRAAKIFAELTPPPPIQWLGPLQEPQFNAVELGFWGCGGSQESYTNKNYGIIGRPPSSLVPSMNLASTSEEWTPLDSPMRYLAIWLTRHLGDCALIQWIADQGGTIHPTFRRLVENSLKRIHDLQRKEDVAELSRITKDSPNAIPGKAAEKLWKIILANRLKGRKGEMLFDWFRRLNAEGLNVSLKLELRDLLRPCVKLRKTFFSIPEDKKDPSLVLHHFHWEISLEADHVGAAIRDNNSSVWNESLPILLDVFQHLLRDAIELMEELNDPNEPVVSHLYLPAVGEGSYMYDRQDWTVLVRLVREAFLATLEIDSEKAKRLAIDWWNESNIVFKRLALFAAAQKGCIDVDEAVRWLTRNGAEYLWSIDTRAETLRLISSLNKHWRTHPRKEPSPSQRKLESTILEGPQKPNISEGFTGKKLSQYNDRQVALLLTTLASKEFKLGKQAAMRLRNIMLDNPDWEFAEEGPIAPKIVTVPNHLEELIEWLKKNPNSNPFGDDNWSERCISDLDLVVKAIEVSHDNNDWYPERLDRALYAWTEDESVLRESWKKMRHFLSSLKNSEYREIIHGLSFWLESAADIADDDDFLYSLVNKIINLERGVIPKGNDPVFEAVNSPVGRVTSATLRNLFKNRLPKNSGLKSESRILFSQICDSKVLSYRHGRVVLARSLANLFIIDSEWCAEYLLPHFDWEKCKDEANACWSGFLYSPRKMPSLIKALENHFYETGRFLEGLGECREYYVRFLTFASVQPSVLDVVRVRAIFAQFTKEDLDNASHALRDLMNGASNKADTLWKESMLAFVHDIWPKSSELKSRQCAGNFAEICVLAETEFVSAFQELRGFIQPFDCPEFVLEKLLRKNLHIAFPEQSLDFVDLIFSGYRGFRPEPINRYLLELGRDNKNLRRKASFRRLNRIIEQ